MSRYGLYGEFGDKNGRFLASLEHDQANVVGPILDIVEQPDAGLTVLRAYFGMLSEFSRQPDSKLGCLVFNSINEIRLHDDVTTRKILEGASAHGHPADARQCRTRRLPPISMFGARISRSISSAPCPFRPAPAHAAAIDNVISVALSSLE